MRRALGAALLAALAFAGSAGATTIRVAVPSLGDPEIGWNLWRRGSELCPSPLRVDARRWRLTCTDPRAAAAALSSWGVARVHGREVEFRASFAWRRFPLFWENAAIAGTRRFPGVSAGPRRVVLERPGLRLEFVRMEPHAAAAAFARGEVDVAPLPDGDLRAALASPALRDSVRLRPLDALDFVRFDRPGGALAGLPGVRRVYWATAPRFDFSMLVSDGIGRPAFGLLPGAPAAKPAEVRAARRRVGSLTPVRVPIGGDRDLASIAVADWRDTGLGPVAAANAPDALVRLTALYPGPEGLFLALQPRPGPFLRRALAAADPLPALLRLDAQLRRDAAVVPLARRVGARLVSPRLRGWRQDALGRADYLRVRATSRRR